MWLTISAAGIAFHAPVAWSMPGLIAPRNSTGQVGGVMNLFGNLSSFAAPVATGYIVTLTGSFAAALLTAGVVLVIGIVSYTFLLGRIEPIAEPAALR
jgi:MFS-type transporter involved in bile tolerance (Atg22 family)